MQTAVIKLYVVVSVQSVKEVKPSMMRSNGLHVHWDNKELRDTILTHMAHDISLAYFRETAAEIVKYGDTAGKQNCALSMCYIVG